MIPSRSIILSEEKSKLIKSFFVVFFLNLYYTFIGSKSNEQRAKSNEQQVKSDGQRAKINEQRATSKKFHLSSDTLRLRLNRKFWVQDLSNKAVRSDNHFNVAPTIHLNNLKYINIMGFLGSSMNFLLKLLIITSFYLLKITTQIN